MTSGFKNGAPAFKVWITKTMQRAMRRHAAVNWSAWVRRQIDRKLRILAEREED